MPGLLRARVGLRPRLAEDPRGARTATNGSSPGRRSGPRSPTYAKWCMLVARTDPDAPKHKGLTYFLMDMEQDGRRGAAAASRSPARREFNEVFIEEARIPDENVVGGVGNGWAVAITTLMNERAGLAFGAIAQIANSLDRSADLLAEIREQRRHRGRGPGHPPADRPAPHRGRDDAAERLPRPDQDDAVGHPRPRGLARQVAVGRHQPGARPSWRSTSRAPTRRSSAARARVANGAWQYRFLRSRANSIEGGTTDILKNIIAERVLGLPRMR